MGIAHLGHCEIKVTDLEKSRWFFTQVMGLFESEADEDHVYLRAWQDWDHHTLTLKRSSELGLDHMGWRVSSREDLDTFAEMLQKQNIDVQWLKEGEERCQGEAIRFRTPAGHPMELYTSMAQHVETNPDLMSIIPTQPQKYIGRGLAPRRIDHVNVVANDVRSAQAWVNDNLGIHLRYYAERGDDQMMGSWLSVTNLSHDIAIMNNNNNDGGKLHHVAYFVDTTDELLRGATLLSEYGIEIEWGPGKHGTSGATFLYFFEPSGNRVEVWTGGMMIFAPDWKPKRFGPDETQQAFERWGSPMPQSYFTRTT